MSEFFNSEDYLKQNFPLNMPHLTILSMFDDVGGGVFFQKELLKVAILSLNVTLKISLYTYVSIQNTK